MTIAQILLERIMLRLLSFTFLSSTLAGCAAIPSYLERPTDPSQTTVPQRYAPVAAETKTYRPVGPKGWEELNRRVAPKS